jgi:ribonuclease T2
VRLALLLAAAGALLAQPRRDLPRGEPGQFDYYVLSLSWSPEYCATPAGERDRLQCAGHRQYGFVTHGLWPQYERGWPQFCAEIPLDAALVDSMLPLMPSPRLVRHEWAKHGTCAGLSPARYFALVRRAFAAFQPPPRYVKPRAAVRLAPEAFKAELARANPSWPDRGFAIDCGGRFFRELRICLDKELRPRVCGRDVRDGCPGPELIVRPVR